MRRVGIALDLDGVLFKVAKRGQKTVIPSVSTAIDLLKAQSGPLWNRIPVVFLTNGGGRTEADRASELTNLLGIPVQQDQIIQSHTPMKDLVPKYKDKLVIASGEGNVVGALQTYGFNKVISSDAFAAQNPSIYPAKKYDPPQEPLWTEERVACAMVCHDPSDWGQDIQLFCDIARSNGFPHTPFGKPAMTEPNPRCPDLYFSNPDLLWSSAHPWPRFGQGAFLLSLQAVHLATTGRDLPIAGLYGKPTEATYSYATRILEEQAAILNQPKPTHFYGIGDNPRSDIRGANAADGWTSVLVRTGLFDGDNDPDDPADHVVDHVGDALSLIMQR